MSSSHDRLQRDPDPSLVAPRAGNFGPDDPAPDGLSNLASERQAQQRQLRDVAALLALPAMWRGHDADGIRAGLLDVLISMLRLEVAYLRVVTTDEADGCEFWRPVKIENYSTLREALTSFQPGQPLHLVQMPSSFGGTPLTLAGVSLELLAVPMLVVIGATRSDFPTDHEVFLFRAAVDQAAIAINMADSLRRERAAREDAEQARAEAEAATQTVEAINRVGQLLTAELDLRRTVQAVTDAATELVGAEFGAFFYNVVDAGGASFQLYTLPGVRPDAFATFPLPRATALFGPTFRGEGVVRVEDVTNDPRYGKSAPYYGMPAGHLPVASYLAVPVISRSAEVLGGLFFGHPQPGVFTEQAEHIVVGLAAYAAVAMDNARLFEQAQRAIALRDEFFSVAAHELRTPLTGVRLSAELLLRRQRASTASAPQDTPTADPLVARIYEQSGKLNRLIDQLLDVSRIEADRLQFNIEETDLAQLVRSTADGIRTDDAGPEIVVETPPVLIGYVDAIRTEQVLVNLLGNARKFSPPELPIHLTLTQPASAWGEIRVRDHGPGIAPEHRAHIFERFYQAASSRASAGLGLGLYISHQIVDLHGGELWAEFPDDGGACFVVRLPLRSPSILTSTDEGH